MRDVSELVTKLDNTDPNFPDGKFKDDVVAGDKQGTEYNKDWPDDCLQPFYSIIRAADDVPNGLPEYPDASQVLCSVKRLINRGNAFIADEYTIGGTANWNDIVAGESGAAVRWVACGQVDAVAYSDDDCLTWTTVTRTGIWNSVAFSPSLTLYCIVGNSGQIETSPNGVTWTPRTSGAPTTTFNKIIWHEGLALFIAVGSVGGAGTIATSPNGATWTTYALGVACASVVEGKVDGNNTAVYVGGFNTAMYYSTDAITWATRTVPAASGLHNGVACNKFDITPVTKAFRDLVVLADATGNIFYSDDLGVTWTAVQAPRAGATSPTSYDDALFVDCIGAFLVSCYRVGNPALTGVFGQYDVRDTTRPWRKIVTPGLTDPDRPEGLTWGGCCGGKVAFVTNNDTVWVTHPLT